jgi:hypothetical protein
LIPAVENLEGHVISIQIGGDLQEGSMITEDKEIEPKAAVAVHFKLLDDLRAYGGARLKAGRQYGYGSRSRERSNAAFNGVAKRSGEEKRRRIAGQKREMAWPSSGGSATGTAAICAAT